jgi:alpha-L-fucosidase 2
MKIQKITINFSLLLFMCLALLLGSCITKFKISPSTIKLWYKEPANSSIVDDPEWLKALPLGNGSLGAMVFGDVNKERIQLSEESMWSGSPNDNDNPDAYPAQVEIRKLLFEGKYKEATALTQQTQICKGTGTGNGNGATVPFGCFQTLGDLWIDFDKQSSYENYHRELNLENALVTVSYKQEGIQYKREIFVSQPDQLIVIKLTADKPGSISFKSSMTRPEKFQSYSGDNQLIMRGTLSDSKGGNGVQYITRLSALNKNGTVKYSGDNLIVKNADEVTLILSASTDYVLKYPNYKGRAYKEITETNLQKGRETSFKELFRKHKEEYQKYFNRVSLKLTSQLDTIPTDIRLQQFKKTESDLHLVELIFQYGRYLLISSSRPGSLPANLQGIWANKIQTPWNGDYHTDINVQMNYWPVEITNLGEMHLPLFNLRASLKTRFKIFHFLISRICSLSA